MNSRNKKAQILVITLLVLTIIGLIVVGVVVLASKDVQQVSTSKKYSTIYNQVETEVKKNVEDVGLKPMSSLVLPGCTVIADGYSCPSSGTVGDLVINYEVTITDKREVSQFEVYKDNSFEITLVDNSGGSPLYYGGGLDIKWTKDVAMDFTLTYTNSSGSYGVIKDVYDYSGVYDSLAASDPYNDTGNIHNFDFTKPSGATTTDLKRWTNFRIDTIVGLGSNYPISLRITPRSKESLSSVLIDVKAYSGSQLPKQVREFKGTGYLKNDDKSPVIKLVSVIPLSPQLDTVFDYSLITNGVVQF